MRRLWIFLTVLALVGPGSAPAFGQMGYAAYSCAKFAEQYGRSPGATERLYFSWAQGFMLGHWMAVVAFELEDDPQLEEMLGKTRKEMIREAFDALNHSGFGVSAQKSFLRRYCDQPPPRERHPFRSHPMA